MRDLQRVPFNMAWSLRAFSPSLWGWVGVGNSRGTRGNEGKYMKNIYIICSIPTDARAGARPGQPRHLAVPRDRIGASLPPRFAASVASC